MKILITGSTGFIGRHLIAALLEPAGHQIAVLVRHLHKLDPRLRSAVIPLPGDLSSLPHLPPGLDIVFHLAGLTKATKAADYYNVNHQGTASLLKALESQEKKIKFIYLSSLAAFGPATSLQPGREEDPPHPINPYGRSKLLGEEEALRYRHRFEVIILRVGGVYGPSDRDFLSFFRFIQRGWLPLFDNRRMRLTLCFVQDLIQALLLAATTRLKSGEVFHIGDPTPYTWEQIGLTVASILGKKVKKIIFPPPLVFVVAALSHALSRVTKKASVINLDKYREMKAAFWTADTSKAQKILGFQPRYTLEQGLRETLTWYKENGWL